MQKCAMRIATITFDDYVYYWDYERKTYPLNIYWGRGWEVKELTYRAYILCYTVASM